MRKERIVLFGAGAFAERCLVYIERYFDIVAVCDNNAMLHGKRFCGKYPIISIDGIENYDKNAEVLIAVDSMEQCDLIKEQLIEKGLRCRHINDALFVSCTKYKEDFCLREGNISLIESIKSHPKNIYVFVAPSHSNLGDQAQTYCIECMLKKEYPDRRIYIFDEKAIAENHYELLYIIKQHIHEDDWVLLHSGYRLTNLYMRTEYIVEVMTELFADRKLLFLPLTVYYTDLAVARRTEKYIKDNVTIMCRDYLSLENAKKLFPAAKAVMYPDVVTSLIGRYHFSYERERILLVMRRTGDGESTLTDNDISGLREELQILADVVNTDTTIDVEWETVANNRKYYVEREIEEYSKYKLIVTNRYHGTIFALAANTPVIVLPTKDHKVTAGLKWFEEAGFENIRICENISEVYGLAEQMLEIKNISNNSDYFYQNYYNDFRVDSF